MYQTLWNSINKQVKNSHASAAFLAVSLMGWTTIGLLAGFLICMIGGMSFVTKITVVLCSGGYTGLIFGFFGGILYLYRTEPRHSTGSAPLTGFHCFPDISQCQDSCPVINRTAVFLSKSYIQNHHQRESYRKENSSDVGVFSGRHFRYKLFYHYIEHSSGSEA